MEEFCRGKAYREYSASWGIAAAESNSLSLAPAARASTRPTRPRLRLRELPAALPGYFLLQETFLYAVPAGLAATQQLHCGGRQLPQALRRQLPREGALGSYCRGSALGQ